MQFYCKTAAHLGTKKSKVEKPYSLQTNCRQENKAGKSFGIIKCRIIWHFRGVHFFLRKFASDTIKEITQILIKSESSFNFCLSPIRAQTDENHKPD